MNIQDFAQLFTKHPHFRKFEETLGKDLTAKCLLRGLNGSEPYFFIALIFKKLNADMLLVMPDADEASDALDDLSSLLGSPTGTGESE